MPDCLVNETLRQELIEYCGTYGFIGYCCCGENVQWQGYIMEVGLDFVRLAGPEEFTTSGYIPLNRVVTFRALSTPAPTAPPGNCATTRTLRQALNQDLCGEYVNIMYCNCDASAIQVGRLNEIGTNFLEIRIAGANPDDVHGTSYEDLVVNLCNICRVMGPVTAAP